MKRYQAQGAMANLNDFSDRLSPDESLMIDWVKHEPWMDLHEPIYFLCPQCGARVNHQENERKELGEQIHVKTIDRCTKCDWGQAGSSFYLKPKEPTICVKCKHIIESEFELKPWMVFASPAILKDAIERTSPKCKCGKLNFINGLTEEINCSDKNHGNCLDFELKE
jgi:hypothetical protein